MSVEDPSEHLHWADIPYNLDTPVKAQSDEFALAATLQLQEQQRAEIENFSAALRQATRIDVSMLYIASLFQHLGMPRFSVERVPAAPPYCILSDLPQLEQITQATEQVDEQVVQFLCACLSPSYVPEELSKAQAPPQGHAPLEDPEGSAWISIHSTVDQELSSRERWRKQKEEKHGQTPYHTAPRMSLAARLKHIVVWIVLAGTGMMLYRWLQ